MIEFFKLSVTYVLISLSRQINWKPFIVVVIKEWYIFDYILFLLTEITLSHFLCIITIVKYQLTLFLELTAYLLWIKARQLWPIKVRLILWWQCVEEGHVLYRTYFIWVWRHKAFRVDHELLYSHSLGLLVSLRVSYRWHSYLIIFLFSVSWNNSG